MHGCQSLSKIYLHFFRLSTGGKHPVKRNLSAPLGFAGRSPVRRSPVQGGFPDKSGKTGSYCCLPAAAFRRLRAALPPLIRRPLSQTVCVMRSTGCALRVQNVSLSRTKPCKTPWPPLFAEWPPHDRGMISAVRPGGYALHRLHGFFSHVHGTHPFLFLLSLLYTIPARISIDKVHGVFRRLLYIFTKYISTM